MGVVSKSIVEWLRWSVWKESASEKSTLLKRGRMKTHIHRTNLQLHLKIPLRYALRHGYDLVPCFTVGDSDMFSWLQESWGHEGQPSKTRPKLQPKQSVTEMNWKKQCRVILCKIKHITGIVPWFFAGWWIFGNDMGSHQPSNDFERPHLIPRKTMANFLRSLTFPVKYRSRQRVPSCFQLFIHCLL